MGSGKLRARADICKENRSVFLLPLLAAFTLEASGLELTAADIAWVARGDFCEPETVVALPDTTLLVSNVCDFRQAGNGYLTLLDVNGQVLDWRVVDGLDAPLGMVMHDSLLHVVDNNSLKIFSWPDYRLVQKIVLDTLVANDIAVAPDGSIFISDTAGHQVMRIGTGGRQSPFPGPGQFPGANGMAVQDGFLYVGGERLWRVSLADQTVDILGPDWLVDIDGIEFERDGTLQLTPVGGPLIRYRNGDIIEILGGEGISSANHGYDAGSGLALIPTGFDNTVVAVRVSEHQ